MAASEASISSSADIAASTKVFANGLLAALTPVVTECDNHVAAVFKSQNELNEQIDILTRELEAFQAVQKSPAPSLVAPLQTLNRSKQRLNNINATLLNIRDRLDRVERLANSDGSGARLPDVLSSIFSRVRKAEPQAAASAPTPAPAAPSTSDAAATRPATTDDADGKAESASESTES
eukprot:TRINITY_DN14416_c0_g1_i1.p1 TRINITY_DN14416_c0_g1~~TRINITY_DN14416_c0_g1_i1.p1  ORF type:complete len:187 (+),score=35.51 TRINITY_DN14416_c0_g1_i1:25-561(+)